MADVGRRRGAAPLDTPRHAETRRTKHRNVNIFINGKMLTQNQNIYAGNRDDNECSFSAAPSNGPSENPEIPPLCRYNESTETADKGVPPAPPYVPADNDARHIAVIRLGDISISHQNGIRMRDIETFRQTWLSASVGLLDSVANRSARAGRCVFSQRGSIIPLLLPTLRER